MDIKEININSVKKTFPLPSDEGALIVLDDISIQIDQGQIIAILGPSGCGKSTLLNIVAGFEMPDQGEVLIRGGPVANPSPERGMVFQSANLFPWLTVKENISYGLKLKKCKRKELNSICSHYIHLVGLEGFENFYPHQLSGGMQQRAALARVLVLESKVLLMDEPFASLDAQSRIVMQQLLLSIWNQIGPTIIFVTHDVEEALVLSDVVCVMSKLPGRVIYEYKVPFERPRPISLIGTAEFSKIKSEIMTLLF